MPVNPADHVGLVYRAANRFRRWRCVELDVLIQAGMLALVNAARQFDESRGVQFSTYACPAIIWAITAEIRQRPPRGLLSLDHDAGLGPLADVVPGKPPRAAEAPFEDREALAFLLRRLPAREKAILCARYGLDGQPRRRLKEIAEQHGLTGERVRQIEAKALKRLRKAAEMTGMVEA